ncbi:SRPBCC domain-containing protein [candidate division KSB1 bacterium]|nr:SRPBCC domain-containing protein [candidate division KSB1 bacterium]
MAASGTKPALADTSDREVVTSRLIRAPRELVYKAWTDPQQAVKWWGPRGFRTTSHESDIRPGGVWRYTMHGPDGRDYPNRARYLELAPPERLVYIHDDGHDESSGFHVTVRFEAVDGGTLLTMHAVFATAARRDFVVTEHNAIEGAKQHLERLAEHLASGITLAGALSLALPSPREFTVTRIVNAPRTLVLEAWTRPEHVVRWWGLRSMTMPVCQIDFRPGGQYRFVLRAPDGQEHGYHGVYKEIAPPDRIVSTFVYEPLPEHEALVTTLFEALGERTRIVETVLHQSQEDRDGHLAAGVEAGMRETFERLEELLRELQPPEVH